MEIYLPELTRIVFSETGDKNTIKQLITPECRLPLNIIEKGTTWVLMEHESRKFYFTSKPEDLPTNRHYVLLTNIAPSKKRFEAGQIIIKKWLKHPDLKEHTPDTIISSWQGNFFFKQEHVQNDTKGLRQPQIGALHMIMGHLTLPRETGTVVLPTGTGKTETMLSALVAHQCKRLLVTVPSDSLRNQIGNKFSTLGLLKEFDIVGKGALFPIVGIIRQGFDSLQKLKDFFEKCNVIVTTMNILNGCSEDEQKEIAYLCSNIFIDEAHHVKAASWNAFKSRFPAEKVLQFTATPFRNDGQRLDGKILFNFPLKQAQLQGYFKKINFISIREYDSDKADVKISEIALERLKKDLTDGYNHILMARCESKERARKIFELYKNNADLNPVLIYSGVQNFKETYSKIVKKESRVIVCVDMLGEGFDLPELKIAAFHDIKKSLPITLQFAGRFTRTKHDEELGDASFIANIADVDVRYELADLYAHDADWNEILPNASFGRVKDEEEYKNLMSGFSKLSADSIPFQNIRPKLSTVVYKNKTTEWFPTNFEKGIPGFDKSEYSFFDINRDEKILVIITAKKEDVEWINHKGIDVLNWNIVLVFWETKNNLLFINSSDNGSLYKELAEAIIGEKAELIRGINVFKSFYDIKRTKLQNVGLRYFLGKNERFRMSVGSDIAEALSIAERQKGEKAFVMGVGYEKGEPVNIGASYKGRIWTKLAGDLMEFKKWCIHLGGKLANDTIDPNQILKETLIPEQRISIPNIYPVWIDWDIDMYTNNERSFRFAIDGFYSDLSNTEIVLENFIANAPLLFSIVTELRKATFELKLFENDTDPLNRYPDFSITQKGAEKVDVEYCSKKIMATKFFEEFVPTIWFADGSALTGNEFVELKQNTGSYPKEEIATWDWAGVDLSKESQGVTPKIATSIQFKVIEKLKTSDYDIIYDDDYAGEIADVVTLKLFPEKLKVELYHLKFAVEGKVSDQIKNLYEVCGQAQKSVRWKHKDGNEFINHLLRRETKTRNGISCSRLELGTTKDLEKLLKIAKQEIPMEFEIYIIQPGVSKATATPEILTLLSVTENYIKEIAGINLKVITSN